MNETDYITQTMFDLADIIAADPLFAGIAVVAEDARTVSGGASIANRIDAVLNPLKQKGVSCFVPFPQMTVSKENIPGPYFDTVNVAALFLENTLLNRASTGTKIRGSVYARRIARIWHLFAPFQGHTVKVTSVKPLRIGDFPKDIADEMASLNFAGWNVQARLELPDDGSFDKVEIPTITVAGGQVSLGCGTASAALRYTVDGSLPTAASGTLYIAPFAAPTDCRLRVVGYLADTIPSDCAYEVFA